MLGLRQCVPLKVKGLERFLSCAELYKWGGGGGGGEAGGKCKAQGAGASANVQELDCLRQ
jgi:hypothetical protein